MADPSKGFSASGLLGEIEAAGLGKAKYKDTGTDVKNSTFQLRNLC